ncbi:hypothetical protein ACS3YM_10005 [Nocardia sp. N13]|uniref:hypothetical protein n=1 Tax=Nocardioides sp. N13(2025) TaxID=3453405 RepID=UPI003F7585E0
MEIHAELVDERDSCWEDDSPRFRVYLHSHPGPGSATSTYDLTGADALQAIDWAQSHVSAGGTYAVALVWERPGPDGPQRGLVWLVGIDGNTDPATDSERNALRRMAERATTPVVVPPADRVD